LSLVGKQGDSLANLQAKGSVDSMRYLSETLFLKNIFGFEALGVLLLVIAGGAVALSRSKGGTHARD